MPKNPEGSPALDALVPELYAELRRLAVGAMAGEASPHTLQPTALVHETYLRLAGSAGLDLSDRRRFLGLAGRVMRQVLVDHARGKHRAKRGSGATLLTLPTEGGDDARPQREAPVDLLALDEALDRLERLDPRQVRIVELRFLAGFEVEEVAKALEISSATVKRETRMALAWLRGQMEGTDVADP